MSKPQLQLAVQAALNGEWDKSHKISQKYTHPTANWLHAVLHKIEGDAWNSKYWYAKTAGKNYEDFNDITEELMAIEKALR